MEYSFYEATVTVVNNVIFDNLIFRFLEIYYIYFVENWLVKNQAIPEELENLGSFYAS